MTRKNTLEEYVLTVEVFLKKKPGIEKNGLLGTPITAEFARQCRKSTMTLEKRLTREIGCSGNTHRYGRTALTPLNFESALTPGVSQIALFFEFSIPNTVPSSTAHTLEAVIVSSPPKFC